MGGKAGLIKVSRQLLQDRLGLPRSMRLESLTLLDDDVANDCFTARVSGDNLPDTPEGNRLPFIELDGELRKHRQKAVGIILLKDRSVRCPDKNRAVIADRPLYDFVLSSLRKCVEYDEIYVSTSSSFYKGVAKGYGLGILDRPPEYDRDDANLGRHLCWAAIETKADIITEISITHPFIKPRSLNAIVEKIRNNPGVNSAFTACKLQGFAWVDGKLNYDITKPRPRTQDIAPVWIEANHYAVRQSHLLAYDSHHAPDPCRRVVEVSEIEAMDVHYPDDLKILEAVYKSGVVTWV